MTMIISVVRNGLYTDSMQAVGDSANDVFVATSEWAWQLTPYGPYYGELSWNISGGDGNDTLVGGAGADTMRGGNGNDVYYVDNVGDVVDEASGKYWVPHSYDYGGTWFDGSTGTDTVIEGLPAYTLPALVEIGQVNTAWGGASNLTGNELNNTLMGAAGNDTLNGGAGDDSLDGGPGLDLIHGGTGNDTARGGDSNDTMFGDAGSDQLFGDAGNDVLLGGAGKDFLTGGAGSDIFKFNGTSESTTVAFDVIQDFVKGVDKIDLSTIDANSLLAGNQAFTFNAAKPFFTSAGDLWVEQGRGFSSVYVDVNGDGNADMRIDLMGTMTLSAADFSL